MTTDSFIIGAYWGSRAEHPHQVVNKILQTLKRLSEVDELFANWYELGWSRKQALEKKVLLDTASIERTCRKAVKKAELDDNGFARNGFLFGLWTGHGDDESGSISFHVGDSFETTNLSNVVYVNIPFEGAARNRLLQPQIARFIIKDMVDIWDPDYAVLTSDDLRDRLNVANDIGWITYLRTIKRNAKPNDKLLYEKLGEGHLFTGLPSGKYDVDVSASDLRKIKSFF